MASDIYNNQLVETLAFTVNSGYNYSNLQDTVYREELAMKTAIYLRVSTTEQGEGFGLEAQRSKCYAMAAVKSWDVVTEYVDDGISGTKDKSGRPALAAMLQAICSGELGAMIIASLDRLGRSTRVVLDIVEMLTECNAEIVSCKESIDTSTPAGRFVLTVFAALTQLDRENIVQRTTDGRNERGKVDGDRGGRLPMGYRRAVQGLEVDQDEAATVKRIFLLRQTSTLVEIAADLNEHKIITSRGRPWHASSVREVLINKNKYQGGFRGESSERWPVILEAE